MNQNLLIDARTAVTIEMDGPCLVVQKSGCSCERFPLRLVNQIMVIGNKLEGLPAAIACASQQINVFFMSAKGDLRAQFLSVYARNTNWNEWFDQCRWNQVWKDRYEMVIEQLWHCLIVESCLQGYFRNRHRKHCYEWVAKNLNLRWGKAGFRNSRHWLHGFVEVLVTSTMAELGIVTSHCFSDRVFADAREMILLRALIDCYEDTKMLPPDSAKMAGLFHQRQTESWRFLLTRIFIALESGFTEIETGLNLEYA